jgi:hypothetical protein
MVLRDEERYEIDHGWCNALLLLQLNANTIASVMQIALLHESFDGDDEAWEKRVRKRGEKQLSG